MPRDVPALLWKLAPFLREAAPFAIAAAAGVRYWIRSRQAQSWPSTQGSIVGANARFGGDRHKRWVCAMSYSYAVNGEYYSGFHSIRTKKEQRADELAREWKGRSVVVRFSPTNPGVSVLLSDDQIGGMGR